MHTLVQALVRGHDEGGAGKGTDWKNLANMVEHFTGEGGDSGRWGAGEPLLLDMAS